MCGRVTLTSSGEEVAEAFGLDEAPALEPRYNIAPSQPVLAVRLLEPEGKRSFALLRWGLKSRPDDKPLINARSETAATRGAFKDAFAHRRCLVPADGFYEWQGPKGAKDRQPFHLRMKESRLFAIAGLWEPALGEDPPTLTLLTTEPNEVLLPIHDRMPVILPKSAQPLWLDPRVSREDLVALLKPYDAAAMEAVPVSTAVNNARFDDPSCLDPPKAMQLRLL